MRGYPLPIFVALIMSSFASAQTGALEVKVMDKEDRTAIIGASVELTERGIGKTVLAEDGTCYFDSLTPGLDSLRILSIGYYKLTRLIEIKADTVTVLDARLILNLLKYSDGGECGTLTHGDPPPRKYAKKSTKITYIPINRNK